MDNAASLIVALLILALILAAIILPQADLEGALIVAERLRARIAQVKLPGAGSLTASLGLASFPEHASAREALALLADQALYKAKRTGRNRVCFPQPEPQTPPPIFSVPEEHELNSVIN